MVVLASAVEDWSVPLVVATAAFLALLLWRVRPFVGSGRPRAGRERAPRRRRASRQPRRSRERALALCDAADLLSARRAPRASTCGRCGRIPTSAQVIERTVAGPGAPATHARVAALAAPRHGRVERLDARPRARRSTPCGSSTRDRSGTRCARRRWPTRATRCRPPLRRTGPASRSPAHRTAVRPPRRARTLGLSRAHLANQRGRRPPERAWVGEHHRLVRLLPPHAGGPGGRVARWIHEDMRHAARIRAWRRLPRRPAPRTSRAASAVARDGPAEAASRGGQNTVGSACRCDRATASPSAPRR